VEGAKACHILSMPIIFTPLSPPFLGHQEDRKCKIATTFHATEGLEDDSLSPLGSATGWHVHLAKIRPFVNIHFYDFNKFQTHLLI
jgi:hypothetical protein